VNSRITKEEWGLIKGALRRIFGRSELRRSIIEKAIVRDYKDPKRKNVKFWVKCTDCGQMEAKSNVQLDHFIPFVPIDSSFDKMSLDEAVNRLWCDESNLKITCEPCHRTKTKAENKERRRLKDLREGRQPKQKRKKRHDTQSKKTPS
jgi:5-methylcytosine-specific restriction endonuclease McrA